LAYIAVHIDLQDPVANLVSLLRCKQVLFRQRNFIRGRDISFFEVVVIRNSVIVWIFNCVVQVNVPVEEDKGHVILLEFSVGFSCVEESFVRPDFLAISKERSAKFGRYTIEFVSLGLAL
jgi:hypothetical protein